MTLSRRIEAGWFGGPSIRGWRALALALGTRVLSGIERAFIKPTHRKAGGPRKSR